MCSASGPGAPGPRDECSGRVGLLSLLQGVRLAHRLLWNITKAPCSVPFPKNFLQICKKILCRLFRVFVHVYIHHFDRVIVMGAEAHVNTCYKHFYYFVTEMNLIDRKELEPLHLAQSLQSSQGYVRPFHKPPQCLQFPNRPSPCFPEGDDQPDVSLAPHPTLRKRGQLLAPGPGGPGGREETWLRWRSDFQEPARGTSG
ncbi:Mps one binder kinase activator-like 2B [Myotis brandtii]|uniref:Mps one binder kinase activator-like 2B n=1 Tax=Myotis brandtii TaxID=109478 RepID=S7NQ98_MYOBR|nr:Mps one binder kinase activator-like 2B [Myotis brandtii]